jgi:hypothetical protein
MAEKVTTKTVTQAEHPDGRVVTFAHEPNATDEELTRLADQAFADQEPKGPKVIPQQVRLSSGVPDIAPRGRDNPFITNNSYPGIAQLKDAFLTATGVYPSAHPNLDTASNMIEGTGKALLPLAALSAVATGTPAIIPIARGAIAAYLGNSLGEYTATKMQGDPSQVRFAGNAGALVGGVLSNRKFIPNETQVQEGLDTAAGSFKSFLGKIFGGSEGPEVSEGPEAPEGPAGKRYGTGAPLPHEPNTGWTYENATTPSATYTGMPQLNPGTLQHLLEGSVPNDAPRLTGTQGMPGMPQLRLNPGAIRLPGSTGLPNVADLNTSLQEAVKPYMGSNYPPVAMKALRDKGLTWQDDGVVRNTTENNPELVASKYKITEPKIKVNPKTTLEDIQSLAKKKGYTRADITKKGLTSESTQQELDAAYKHYEAINAKKKSGYKIN